MLPLASVYVAVPALVAVITSKEDGFAGSRSNDSEASGAIIDRLASYARIGFRDKGSNLPNDALLPGRSLREPGERSTGLENYT